MTDTVWVVQYTNGDLDKVAAIYDNEVAAQDHVVFHNGIILDGHSDGKYLLKYEAWGVRSEHGVVKASD